MPIEGVVFKNREELLTFEEITRFTEIAAAWGVRKIRLTGGEPLVRADLPKLVQSLNAIPGIEDLALTTNGLLLANQAEALQKAGLHRVNISLDTLRESVFEEMSRRTGLAKVLEGIAVAKRVGFRQVRLNAIAIAGITDKEIVPLAKFARKESLELRFIEFMPLDAEGAWNEEAVLSGATIRKKLEAEFGPLSPAPRSDPSQPAVNYTFDDAQGTIGFINPVSEPFCGSCNRLRLTAEGKIRNCLFSLEEWDARKLLRSNGTDRQIGQLIQQAVLLKKTGHGIDQPNFVRPERTMHQIGG